MATKLESFGGVLRALLSLREHPVFALIGDWKFQDRKLMLILFIFNSAIFHSILVLLDLGAFSEYICFMSIQSQLYREVCYIIT